MIVMADPVSISASCGVLLQITLTNIGLYVAVVVFDDVVSDDGNDDFRAPQGSSPSHDPLIRKNNVEDNHVFYELIVHI